MPFGIRKSKNKWKVINKHTGRVLGSHDSESMAKKQLAAVQINYGKESIQEVANALEYGQTTYNDNTKYHGFVPEIQRMNPKIIMRLNSDEVGSVSDEVANSMDFSKPIDVSIYRDGEIICQDGHHRLAAAKQRNMDYIKVKVTAINAYGKMINMLIQDRNIKEDIMNLKESNELIMSLSHKHNISVSVLEHLWTEAISKQEENAKTREEKDKSNPKFWNGVRSKFKNLIDNLEIQEAKAIMDSRERYTQSTSQWLDHIQNGDYASAEKVFPDVMKSKLDIMVNDGKEKYLKQMSDKINKQSKD